MTAGLRAAHWQHVALPAHAAMLERKVALAWRAIDAFHEEDGRILGHAADPNHRIDLRRTSRHDFRVVQLTSPGSSGSTLRWELVEMHRLNLPDPEGPY